MKKVNYGIYNLLDTAS